MNGHPDSTDRRPGVSTVVTVTHVAASADSHVSVSLPSLPASDRPIESVTPVNKWVDAYERGRSKLLEDRHFIRKYKLPRAEWQEAEKTRAAAAAATARAHERITKRAAFDLPLKWIEPVAYPGRQWSTLCFVCNFALSWRHRTDLWCQYCSTVAHRKCLDESQRYMTKKREWICPECIYEISDSRQRFLAEFQRRHEAEVRSYYQTRLAARWRGYVQKQEFYRLTKSATKLQAFLR